MMQYLIRKRRARSRFNKEGACGKRLIKRQNKWPIDQAHRKPLDLLRVLWPAPEAVQHRTLYYHLRLLMIEVWDSVCICDGLWLVV